MTFTGVWDTFTCPTESVFGFVNLLPNQLQNWNSVTASPKECCREDTVISLETVPSYSSNTLQVPLCCSHIRALYHTPLSWRVELGRCTALCKHQQLSPGWRKIGCWLLNYTVQERNVMGYLNILNTLSNLCPTHKKEASNSAPNLTACKAWQRKDSPLLGCWSYVLQKPQLCLWWQTACNVWGDFKPMLYDSKTKKNQ